MILYINSRNYFFLSFLVINFTIALASLISFFSNRIEINYNKFVFVFFDNKTYSNKS